MYRGILKKNYKKGNIMIQTAEKAITVSKYQTNSKGKVVSTKTTYTSRNLSVKSQLAIEAQKHLSPYNMWKLCEVLGFERYTRNIVPKYFSKKTSLLVWRYNSRKEKATCSYYKNGNKFVKDVSVSSVVVIKG